MSGAEAAVMAAQAIAGGGGGSPPTFVGSTENSAFGSGTTGSCTRSCTAGNSVVVCIRWYNVVTVSSITCSGETVTLVGSPAVNGLRCSQFAVINNVASTASKTVDVTLSGSASNISICLVEFSGAKTSGIAGAHPAASTGTSANPSHSVTTTADNSAIVGILMSNISGATPGTGYSNLSFNTWWSYEYGQYDADVGAAGAKTVNWTMSSEAWHIDALEVLAA